MIDRTVYHSGLSYKLAHPELTRWLECESGYRFLIFNKKKLVVYRVEHGSPCILDTLTCVDLCVSFAHGVSSLWDGKYGRYCVGHTPIEIEDNVFLWHKCNTTVEYIEFNGRHSARATCLCRMKSDPKLMQEGSINVLELATFNSFNFGGADK